MPDIYNVNFGHLNYSISFSTWDIIILIELYMALCLFTMHILSTFGYSQYFFDSYYFLHFTYYSNHTLCYTYDGVWKLNYNYVSGGRH